MCFIINILQDAMHDDILSRGGGARVGEGLILVLKLSFKLFIVGKSVSNNAMLTDNASYKLEANL